MKNQESKRQMLMMLFANCQIAINLTDELPAFKELYKQDFKNLTKRYSSKNLEMVEKLYKLMDVASDKEGHFETAFNMTTDAVEVFMDCIKNNNIEVVITLLKALKSDKIKYLSEDVDEQVYNSLTSGTI